MIDLGIGIDISEINRFEKFVNNERFYKKIFTENEISVINKSNYNRKIEIIAGKFSGKEAVSKALGTGIGKISFKDIEILREALTFIKNEKGRAEAQQGCHDDKILGTAITYEIAGQQSRFKKQEIREREIIKKNSFDSDFYDDFSESYETVII